MSCEYCKNSSENEPIFYDPKTCTVIEVCAAGLSILACDDHHWVTEISHCPMCGDPLESPEALTPEQLKGMIGNPVWTTHYDGSGGKCGIVQYDSTLGLSAVVSCDEERWFEMKAAQRPIAYTHKPKREG